MYKDRVHNTRIIEKIPVSVVTALVGIVVANPTEVVKIRLQEQAYKQNYEGCIDCYIKIFKTEGIKGFWSGVRPNLMRNIVDSPAEIVTYYHSKEFILRKGWLPDSLGLHFICGLVISHKILGGWFLYFSGGKSFRSNKDKANDSIIKLTCS